MLVSQLIRPPPLDEDSGLEFSIAMKNRLAIATAIAIGAAGLVLAIDPREPQFTAFTPGPAPLQAQLITVTAEGSATAPSSYLSMKTAIKAHAEVAVEATENFAQTRQRTVAGLSDVELEGAEVISDGLEFEYMPEPSADANQGFVVNRSGEDPPKPGVTCIEPIELRFLPAADELTQRAQIADAIDQAVELGLKLKTKANTNPYYNPSIRTPKEGAVEGHLSDEAKTALERAAIAAAMERARVLAGELAAASGKKLGSVNGVALKTITTDWKGIGQGVEATASMSVSFQLTD